MGKSLSRMFSETSIKKRELLDRLRNYTKPRREKQVQRGENAIPLNLQGYSVMVTHKNLTLAFLVRIQVALPQIKLVTKRSGYRQTRPILKLSITVCRWQCIAPRKDRLRLVSVTCVINQRRYLIMRQHASLKGLIAVQLCNKRPEPCGRYTYAQSEAIGGQGLVGFLES